MKPSRIIALLTDFGNEDTYVASVKGMILSISPSAQIVDISHSVKPQNISQASYLLWNVYKHFPKGTIFIAVVDPGVGGKRRNICVEGNGYTFLAPDNGLLQYLADDVRFENVISITNNKYFGATISRTFHGRDVFAPVAAHIAEGTSIKSFGPHIILSLTSKAFVTIATRPGKYEGKILHIDHFGNIITDYRFTKIRTLMLKIGKRNINAYSQTYEDAPPKIPFLIEGSSGLLEISIKNGNAAEKLKAKLNQSLELTVA
jgi:S-adenosyl-L-methionine hydrolase (adenosine-forming)